MLPRLEGRAEADPYAFEYQLAAGSPTCVYSARSRGRQPLLLWRMEDPFPIAGGDVLLVEHVPGYVRHASCALGDGILACLDKGDPATFEFLLCDPDGGSPHRLSPSQPVPPTEYASRMCSVAGGALLHRDGTANCFLLLREPGESDSLRVQPLPEMPLAVGSPAVFGVSGCAWVVGGKLASGFMCSDVQCFDPGTGEWTRWNDHALAPRSFCPACELSEGVVVLLGGYTSHAKTRINDLYACCALGRWERLDLEGVPQCDLWDSVLCVHRPADGSQPRLVLFGGLDQREVYEMPLWDLVPAVRECGARARMCGAVRRICGPGARGKLTQSIAPPPALPRAFRGPPGVLLPA